jgi:hypothetical protein
MRIKARGLDATLKAEIATYRAEARFLRAMTYWHLIDMFGGGSLVTEDSFILNMLQEQSCTNL